MNINIKTKTNMKDKYIVIDTWNGEGYSHDNGTEIKTFPTKSQAIKYAKDKRNHIVNNGDYKSYDYTDSENVFQWGDEEINDYGSYQVYKLKDDDYAIEILVNVNEVVILTKKEYKQRIKDLNKQIFKNMYKAMTLDDFHSPTNLEYYIFIEENKDEPFYSGVDEFDYQFRIINFNK
jgi:hypothetical protein